MMRVVMLLLCWPVLLSAQGIGEQLAQLTFCYATTLAITPPWSIAINFDTTKVADGWTAATQASVDYHSAVISFDTLRMQALGSEQVRRVIVHELWHIVLWELGELAQQADSARTNRVLEQKVQHAARILAPRVCR